MGLGSCSVAFGVGWEFIFAWGVLDILVCGAFPSSSAYGLPLMRMVMGDFGRLLRVWLLCRAASPVASSALSIVKNRSLKYCASVMRASAVFMGRDVVARSETLDLHIYIRGSNLAYVG